MISSPERHASSLRIHTASVRGVAGSSSSGGDQSQGSALVDRDVFGLVTLDEVLWLFPRGMVNVSLERRILRNLLDDNSLDVPSLGIPLHMIIDFERFRHGHSVATGSSFRQLSIAL